MNPRKNVRSAEAHKVPDNISKRKSVSVSGYTPRIMGDIKKTAPHKVRNTRIVTEGG